MDHQVLVLYFHGLDMLQPNIESIVHSNIDLSNKYLKLQLSSDL